MNYVNGEIHQGDCLELMKDIPSESIDMILCDLPYGTTQNKWDSIIPLNLLWQHYERIIKPRGVIVLNSQGIFTAKLILSNERLFRYKYVWIKSKSTNFLNAKRQPLRQHEDNCVFYKKQPHYNPIMFQDKPYDKGVRKNQQTGSYGQFNPAHIKSNGQSYPTDAIYCKTAESESGQVWHPTQKPVALGRYLIRTFTQPGNIVLDNCSGSGSYLVAAAMENRRFIGIEKNDNSQLFKEKNIDYIEITKQRLQEVEHLYNTKKTMPPIEPDLQPTNKDNQLRKKGVFSINPLFEEENQK